MRWMNNELLIDEDDVLLYLPNCTSTSAALISWAHATCIPICRIWCQEKGAGTVRGFPWCRYDNYYDSSTLFHTLPPLLKVSEVDCCCGHKLQTSGRPDARQPISMAPKPTLNSQFSTPCPCCRRPPPYR